MTPKMPAGIMDALKMLPMVNRLRDLMPKTVRDAPCQEVVEKDGSLDALPDPEVLAGRRRPLHHAAARLHQGPRDRHAQHRHLPHAGVRRPDDRHALAAAQGRRAAPPRRRASRASACRWRWRSAPIPRWRIRRPRRCPKASTSCCSRAFSRRERIELVKCVTVDLEVPASAHIVLEGYVEPGERRREGPFGDHTGFYSHPDDLPGLPPDLHHAPQAPDLSDDGRRHSADGGLLPRQGQRADLPAAHQEDGPRDRRHALSGRRHLPQHRHHLDRQALSRPRPQDHERRAGGSASSCSRRRSSSSTRTSTCRTRPRSPGSSARTSTPSATSSSRAARSTTSRTRATSMPTAARWASTRRASGRRRASRAPGRRRSPWPNQPRRKADEVWQRVRQGWKA